MSIASAGSPRDQVAVRDRVKDTGVENGLSTQVADRFREELGSIFGPRSGAGQKTADRGTVKDGGDVRAHVEVDPGIGRGIVPALGRNREAGGRCRLLVPSVRQQQRQGAGCHGGVLAQQAGPAADLQRPLLQGRFLLQRKPVQPA